MADTKVSNFPPSAGLVLTDIFPVVDDPGGTPVAQKATFTQLQTLLGTGNFVLKSGDVMTGALVHPAGTSALPSITFTGDLDTGVFLSGADVLGFSAGGTVILTATTAGVAVVGNVSASSLISAPNVDVSVSLFSLGDSFFGGGLEHQFQIGGQIGFFGASPVLQQSAAANTLAQVLTALRAYGLLAP